MTPHSVHLGIQMLLWSTKIHDLIHEPRTPPPSLPKPSGNLGRMIGRTDKNLQKYQLWVLLIKTSILVLNRNSGPQKKAHYGKTTSKILTIVKEANTDDTKAQVAKS